MKSENVMTVNGGKRSATSTLTEINGDALNKIRIHIDYGAIAGIVGKLIRHFYKKGKEDIAILKM